ncbi:mucin-4-like isoform X2 [Mytilus edulis]|uniref:mucin-4-like isoform X2 n=1 Tax=Mytilus edulis TaxID=6550 RepID=UPI0039F01B51
MGRVSYWINKIGELLPPIENSPDKERMGRVSYWINKIGELLPPIENSPDKERMGRSTLEIVETAWEYITQLKAQTTPDMTEDVQRLEIQRLKTDIEKTKLERDRYVDIIRNAGLSTDMTPGIWAQKNVSPVLSAININNQDLDPKQKSNKNRKRNTISQQLENMKKQQEELTAPNIMQMNNQNMLMNQMQMMNNQMMMPNQAGFPQTFLPGQMTLPGQAGDKDQSSADLLQGAMQESGITPNSNSQTGTIEDLVTQHSSESALQTLASVASQNLVSGSTAVVTCQSVSLTNTSQSSSVTTVTTQSVNTSNPIMATGQMMQNNSTGLMPFVNGQQNFPGNMFQNQQGFNNPLIQQQQQQQQIVFINEQGIPCIANVPMDPMMQNKVTKTEPAMDQAFNQQQQMNIALQNQLAGLTSQNQMNMAGGLIQQQFPMNQQQLLQGQLGATMNQQGLILPVSQAGNLINVNNMAGQNQLPQALILPNGQIVPVVTNPQMLSTGQNQLLQTNQWRPPVPQPMTSAPMQIIQQNQPQTGQDMQQQQQSLGLLMTTNSVSSQSSPRPQISMANQSSITTSTMSHSAIPNHNKTVDSSFQDSVMNKVNTSVEQMIHTQNGMLPQPQNNIMVPASTCSSQISTPMQLPKPANTTVVSQPNHPQTLSGNAPIIINMSCNGQPTSILVDPTTMQVLGTVQTQQPAPAAVPQPPAPQQATPPSGAKKSKKRVLCPKPSANGPNIEDVNVETQTAELKKTTVTKSKVKPKKAEPESTTDILAKAAQSIFSSEISPVNFYNPANEDNPLQIDTSVAEPEDETKRSPQKGAEIAKNLTEIQQDEVAKLIEDQIKQVDDQNKAEKEKAVCKIVDENVMNIINEEAKNSLLVSENKTKIEEQPGIEQTSKKAKKSKKSEPEISKELEPETKPKNRKTSSARKGKQQEDIVVETKDLPEAIIFSENDLSSVLDQVEGLASPPPSKKTKSKKTKSDTNDIEPVSKKRKHTPTKSKMASGPEKEPVAKTSKKSVYDFEEEEEEMIEDFSQPLFGLHPLRNTAATTNITKGGETKKEKNIKKTNDKKKPKEVKMDDSLLSPASDDLQINLDVDKQKDENSVSPEKRIESAKMDLPKNSHQDVDTSFTSDKRMDYPNLEVTNGFAPPTENQKNSVQNSNSELLSHPDIMPLDISTGNDSTDIDNAMSSILGFSTNSLSPHIVSPKPRNQTSDTTIANSVISPVTVSSISPLSMVTTTSCTTSTPSVSQDLSVLISESEKLTSTSLPSETGLNSVLSKEKQESLLFSQSKQSERSGNYSATEKLPSGAPQNSIEVNKKSSDSSKTKSIYSADNFVQSSRNDLITSSSVSKYNDKVSTVQSKTTSSTIPVSYSSTNTRNNRSEVNDRPNTIKYGPSHSSYREASPDGFNFASIGLNLSTTAPSGSFIDSLNMSPIMSTCSTATAVTSSFTFTLSSVKSTVTQSSAPSSHIPSSHQTQTSHSSSQSSPFPVYQAGHHHSPGSSSAKPYHGMNLPSFDMDLSRNMNSQMNRNSVQSQQQQRSNHDRIPPMQSQNNVPFPYGAGDVNRESCSLREQPRELPRERTPVFQNITATTPPIVNKSQSDQIRNTQKQIQDLSQNHNVPPKQHSDMNRNMNPLERGPVPNNMQPFFSANPQNTPPLHHPPLMADNGRQNIVSRNPYDPFPPAQSQVYNPSSSAQSYNRYESNSMPYSSHNSSGGTQPLSHTPPSSDGRKSANALPTNSKQNTNQSARAMSGPSPGSGPTPPVTNRHTPPQAVHPQQTMPKSQRPQTASSGNSKKSKPSQKRTKQPAYEMNEMHYPLFDPNRMTPFLGHLPPQALSPPSRNVQNDAHMFSGNFLGHSSRPLSNSASAMNKNSDFGGPFNSIFPPSRGQNGLGLNFQPGFGSMHPSMSNAPSLTPHSGGVTVTPHMPNFSFSNIFPDSSQSDSPINISPIKLHGNQIMDSNSLQHHQGSSLFHPHNRSHHPSLPNAMSINSILGHNHHGFDTRQMTQGMNSSATPFGSHGHPHTFGMPPFS